MKKVYYKVKDAITSVEYINNKNTVKYINIIKTINNFWEKMESNNVFNLPNIDKIGETKYQELQKKLFNIIKNNVIKTMGKPYFDEHNGSVKWRKGKEILIQLYMPNDYSLILLDADFNCTDDLKHYIHEIKFRKIIDMLIDD